MSNHPFPVIASTLSADALNILLQNHYELPGKTSCRLFRTGINHTYFVSGDEGTNYVLRVYACNWRTEQEILEELDLLNLLKEHRLNVSYPIAGRQGSYLQSIDAPEGKRPAVLFSFAEGKKVRFMNEETLYAIGSLMGSIHHITENRKINRSSYTIHTLLQAPYEYACSRFDPEQEEMQFIRETAKQIEAQYAGITTNTLRSGILHMDCWYDNMSVNEKGEVTLFDFDFCGNGWLIHDIAYFLKQLYHIETEKGRYEAKARAFLNGYRSRAKLSEAEMELVPMAGAACWIFYLGEQSRRFDWSNIFLSENYLKMYVGKMRDWLQFHEAAG